MKKIDSMASNAIKSKSQEYISEADKEKIGREILSAGGALACLLAGFVYIQFFPDQDVIVGIIYLLGVLIVGIPIVSAAIKGLFKKEISSSLEILVSIAMIICVLDNKYSLAIVIPVILNIVHFFEEKSIMGGRDAIEALKKMQASTAILLTGEGEKIVDAKSLDVGDRIVVKPGMALPIDGSVLRGCSSIDQKSLTGEAVPKPVNPGVKVFAGTNNIEGELIILVEKPYTDTSFQKIVKLLEEAEKIEIPETRILDDFMVYYIPLVLLAAVFAWIISQDVTKAVAILVVSCPCGLILVNSAPVIAALSAASKRGILIKNSVFIEQLAEANYVIFDKTGTVTKGTLEASDYYLDKAESYEDLISAAASVSHSSLHPVSKSIVLLSKGIEFQFGYEVKEYMGKGLIGTKDESKIILGNSRWLGEMGLDVTDKYDLHGNASWVVRDGEILGCIIFKDVPREDAKEMIGMLKSLGIEKNCMLTGDNYLSAKNIQEIVGIEKVYHNLLPEEKLSKVKELKEEFQTVFVGDGINDALALAEAHVGIAMGAMGSDTAIQSADISLMNNDLSNIPFAIQLAKKTKSIIYQNIVIAFLTSFILIFLAAGGIVGAISGAFLHNIGAFIVLLNSGRIMKN